MTDNDTKRYKTVDRKVIGFPLDRSMPGEMVKPGELIDIKEISPLTLTDRRIYNLLIANAWDNITEPVEHIIDKSDLRGTHNGNERIEDSIRRLMGAIAEVKILVSFVFFFQNCFHLVGCLIFQNQMLYFI